MAGTESLERGLALLEAIARDDGAKPLSALATELRLPQSTARRLLAALERRGFVLRIARGRYAGGVGLLDLARPCNPHRALVETARGPLRRLARSMKATAHLGVFERDMVTYLIKEGVASIFTREGEQLEAYCTGIGKALLAHLPPERLETYLQGSFVRLTNRTLVEPDQLRAELERSRARGYAIDDREMADDITCVAVPLIQNGRAIAAISLSVHPARMTNWERFAQRVSSCAREISGRLETDAIKIPAF